MLTAAVLHEMFDHNYWARDVQLRACEKLTNEQFLQPMGGSFGSLRDTLVHLLGVEMIWLERWKGGAPREMLPADSFTTLESIAVFWRKVEAGMREYAAGLDDAALEREFTYTNMRGVVCTYAMWRMQLHLLMHQSMHRGQVNTLLRQLGAEAATVDFLSGYDEGFRS